MRRKIIILLILGILLTIGIIGINHRKVIVCLDAGHGGKDVGAVAENGNRQEKEDNLKLVLKIKEYLEKQGIKVILTRKDDTYVTLNKRCQIANFGKADIFVSMHRNSAKSGNGVEIWRSQKEGEVSEKLAKDILENLEKVGIQNNRGVKEGMSEESNTDYFVNRNTKMPSCLVELGFITNEKDNQLLDEKLNQYAEAIAKGILQNVEKKRK